MAIGGSRLLILEDDVRAGTTVENVKARTADQHVVAETAQQNVIAGTANEIVIIVTTVYDKPDKARRETRGLDDVVAGKCLYREQVVNERVVRRLASEDRHGGG